MGLVSVRRCGLLLVAAAVAMTLSMFVTTAPVPAATLTSQAQHLGPARHLTSFQIPLNGKADPLVGDAICLTKAGTHCSAFDADTVYTAILSTINTAIIIYSVIHNRKTGSNEDKSEGDEGGNTKTSNLCLGVTGKGADVKYRSCSAKHGVWWNWNSYKSGYRVWNTYAKQYLTVNNDHNGTKLYVSPIKSGTWQNWTVEFCDGC